MTDRTTLARLGKLVAVDVATGHPGANSWTASQVLEAQPEAVLDLIEMLVTEGRKTRPNEQLVTAYVYMIGQALEFIRMDLENGQASARELAEAIRRALLQAGTSGRVEPTLLMMILMQFSNAKLDPGADLQRLMADLVEQIGLQQGADTSGGDFDAYLKDLVEGSAAIRSRSMPRCWRWQGSSRQTTAPPWASRCFERVRPAPEKPLWDGCSTRRLRCGRRWHPPSRTRPATGLSQAACSGA